MAQFRLTKKFATDIKVAPHTAPCLLTPMIDDWFIDVIRVQRKKVALVTHAKSLITFLLPYEQVGGAKTVPDCIPVLLTTFLYDNNLESIVDQVEQTFSKMPAFCKTNNQRVLGHMNDFKRCIQAHIFYDNRNFYDIAWDEIMHAINHMPIGTQGYRYPVDIAKELFSGVCIN